MKRNFFKITVALAVVFTTLSCDKDFNSVGSDIIGDDHFDLEKYEVENLLAYSKATGAVQSNNLPINALGIYNNPALGITKAHFVSQLELSVPNPTIGNTPVVDSVYLYVPYFSTLKPVTESGERVYELDSVYGYSDAAKFKLHVYENGYFLRDLDPDDDFETSQKYYSNQKGLFDTYKGSELLNNSSDLSQNEEFLISNKEILIYKTNGSGVYIDESGAVLANQSDVTLRVVKDRKAPGIWLDLKNSFFQQKIIDAAGSGVLFNNSTFKEYFRGLLFEVEELNPGQGALAMLDFSNAEIKILYKSSINGSESVRRSLGLQMGFKPTANKRSNTVSFFEHTISSLFSSGLAASNSITGDEKLYLKGGNGSIAFIDLFGADLKKVVDNVLVDDPLGNGVPDELDKLRIDMKLNRWLINEANLTFHIDRSNMAAMGQVEPERIYIFDATNNKPILDYFADNSVDSNAKKNKRSFGGIIERDSDKNGIKYKIKLTDYIRELIKNENEIYSDNIRIGVAVIESINTSQSASIDPGSPIVIGADEVRFLPVSSIMSPLGTVLYGNNVTDQEKKLKLQIFFTKPN